ncbi:MAG TPA: hypothetical protein VGI30_10080 [Caulobacteraceae bacterium]
MIRKIILHAGTEKTGTTALQLFLEAHTDDLAARGVVYPPTGEDYRRTGRFPKHRWLIEALMAEGQERFARECERALAACPAAAHTLILSDEALYGDWPHVTPAGRAALAALAQRFETELWVWFREPVAYARSQYVQMLKNPRGGPPGNGRDLGIDEAIELPWFVSRLDYIGFVRDLEGVLGAGQVRPFVYAGDSIAAFLAALDLEDLEAGRVEANRTMGEAGVAILRILNRFEMDQTTKTEATRLVEQLDGVLPAKPLALGAKTKARIGELTAPSRVALARDYGLTFGP